MAITFSTCPANHDAIDTAIPNPTAEKEVVGPVGQPESRAFAWTKTVGHSSTICYIAARLNTFTLSTCSG